MRGWHNFKWFQHQGHNYAVFAENFCSVCVAAVVACRLVQTKSAWSGVMVWTAAESPVSTDLAQPFFYLLFCSCCFALPQQLHCSISLPYFEETSMSAGLISSFPTATSCGASPGWLLWSLRYLSSVSKLISDPPRLRCGRVMASKLP